MKCAVKIKECIAIGDYCVSFCDTIKRSCFCKAFYGLFVKVFCIYAPKWIEDVFVGPSCIALFDDGSNCVVSNVFNSRKSKPNTSLLFSCSNNGKIFFGFVNVGRKYGNVERHCICNFNCLAVGVTFVARKKCRHKFCGVLCFQVCRLVGDHGVACSMRAIKSVPRKWFNKVPHVLCCCLVYLLGFYCAGDKFLALLIEQFFNFLSYSFSENIGFCV